MAIGSADQDRLPAHLRDRPLANRNDAASRTARSGSAPLLSRFLRLLQPEPLAHQRAVFQAYATFLAPEQRPMDNMAAGWDRPQEDEFACACSGCRVPTSTSRSPMPAALSRFARPHWAVASELAAGSGRSSGSCKQLTFRDPEATGFEVADAYGAHSGVAGSVPRCAIRPHRPRLRVVVPSTVPDALVDDAGPLLPEANLNDVKERVFQDFEVIYRRLEEARPLLKPGLHEIPLRRAGQESHRRTGAGLRETGVGGFDEARRRLNSICADRWLRDQQVFARR